MKPPGWPYSGYIASAIWIANIGFALLLLLPKAASGSVVASMTALLIAFVAYSWQKNIDRALLIDQELRGSLGRYLQAECRLVVACQSAQDPETRQWALKDFDESFALLTAELKLSLAVMPKPNGLLLSAHYTAFSQVAYAARGAHKGSDTGQLQHLIRLYNENVGGLANVVRSAYKVPIK